MRITEQVLVVRDYQGEREDVIACCDGIEEAREYCERFCEEMPCTLVRVRIVEELETIPF